MISYQQALDLIRQRVRQSPRNLVPLHEALGRTAAQTLVAPFAVPTFDNSAMDGFALRHHDCLTASGETPLCLPVQSIGAAGQEAVTLKPGFALQIMTGAPLPFGSDTVIPIENVEVLRDEKGRVTSIAISKIPEKKKNIRLKGEDFQENDQVVEAGTRLTPHHIMALALFGQGATATYAIPDVLILATGNELFEPLSGPLSPSGIYNSNSPYLLAMCQQAGLPVSYHGIIPDSQSDFVRKIQSIMGQRGPAPRIILSTGAVSRGDFDFVPSAMKECGAEIIFHKVAIKPGKPILFAVLPNGDYFFGLPGNPISSAVGFCFFVMPLLRAMFNVPDRKPIMAQLNEDHKAKPGLRQFLKARLELNQKGEAHVSLLPGQESFKIKPLLRANGWIVLDEHVTQLAAGDLVAFEPSSPWNEI